MPYVVATALVALFAVFETSFLPLFKIFDVVPAVTLAFFAALGVRYRGSFHLLLAFFTGIYFDAISASHPGLFTALFVLTVFFGRVVFFRETGYNSFQSFLILICLSLAAFQVIEGISLYLSDYQAWLFFSGITIAEFITTILFGFIIYRYFDKFFDWLNKMSEERFR